MTGKSDNTAAGCSKLKIGLLRDLDEAGLKALLALFNSCLVTGTIPSSRKKIIIVPLPKKHHITFLQDTRPISLFECCLKILTGIINKRTLACWVKHKSLHPAQYALLPGTSSADPVHITRCVYEISNERVKQKIMETPDCSSFIHVAYLDIAKAYDSVEHTALNFAMKSLGVPEGILGLLLEIDKECSRRSNTHPTRSISGSTPW